MCAQRATQQTFLSVDQEMGLEGGPINKLDFKAIQHGDTSAKSASLAKYRTIDGTGVWVAIRLMSDSRHI